MNKSPLVTVIIPAYNTEQYIGEMLECVIRQTYKNLQIILIDDGSTDKTQEVIRGYQKSDSRIEFVETNRGGVSRARNIGIDKAKGKKIFFWDSDDIIEVSAIERIVDFSYKENVSSVLYGYSNYIDGIKYEAFSHKLMTKYSENEIVENLMPHFIGHSFSDIEKWISGKVGLREGKEHTALWRIMIDADVLSRADLKFDENLSLGEDTKFINSYFIYEDSIGFLDECFYYLRKRMNGLNMTSQSNPVLMASNKLKLIKARTEIDEIANKKGYSTHYLWERTIVFSAVELAIRLSKEVQKEEGIATFVRYTNDPIVKETIGRFKPGFGIKALPFYFLKIGNGSILYRICALIPKKLIKKFVS